MVTFDEQEQKRELEELKLQEEEDLVKMLAGKHGLSYLDLSIISINTDALRLIPEPVAREAGVAAFKLVGKKIDVATVSPTREKAVMAIRELAERGYEPTVFMVSKRSVERAWERYKELSYAYATQAGVLNIGQEQLDLFLKTLKTFNDLKQTITETLEQKKYHISQLLEMLLAGGIVTDASDIHIEPEEKNVTLRLRLDGVLQELTHIEHKVYILILSRIKLVSGLKLNIKDSAQDGRYSIKIGDTDIEIRTSIVPGAYGESIVMRILNPKTIRVPFEELGVEPKLFERFEYEIRKPNGMLLNTGPTGSGKTTTLYAFLRKVHTPEVKIITIEDPIEYHLVGITQTQVEEEKGYTFATGLRASLRQDPDVILVGEIRDSDTASTAIHASLTGHLVFSTLHTNNAAGAIPRLIDLGINPKIISSAVTVAIAQRLVRKLCTVCKKERVPNDDEKNVIDLLVKTLPDPSFTPKKITLFEAPGCGACNQTGYKGRIGIFEAILMDGAIEHVIQQNPSEREIKKAAQPQGIPDMQQDGILKAIRGVTSFAELERVVDLRAPR